MTPQPSNNDTLTIAVVSDIHAHNAEEPDSPPSHCCVTTHDPTKNALEGLCATVTNETLRADLLLCPGDLGDRAHPLAVQYVWHKLHTLKDLLGASHLIAATGNHDVDSRHAHNRYDAKGVLQALHPPYPSSDDRVNDRYWSRHFAFVDTLLYRLLVINSSAFHGEGRFKDTGQYEYERGRISPHTLGAIRTELANRPRVPISILMCHHHPHPHAELGLGADDLMIGGQDLLTLLGENGRWLIIHGHKHHPKIEYAAGGASAPIVFAAGSAAVYLYGELQTSCRNQFYLVTLSQPLFDRFGYVGTFRAWDWLSGQGWRPALKGSQLPSHGGFGWREDIHLLAQRVYKTTSKRQKRWDSILSKLPELGYVLPKDVKQLMDILANEYKCVLEPRDTPPPLLIARS